MGPMRPDSASPPITARARGANIDTNSLRTDSDFQQSDSSESSSNTKVALGKSPKSKSKPLFPKKTLRTGHITPVPHWRAPDPGHYLPAQYPPPLQSPRSRSPPLPDSSSQLVGQAQAPREPSATLTSNASSATTPPPALHNSTALPPRLESWNPSPELHNSTFLLPNHTRDISESGEELEFFDSYGDVDASMEFAGPYSSGSVSPALIPAPNLHWQLLSYHPAQPNLSVHFDIAFPTHDIEYMQDSSYRIQRMPLSDADLDKPAANKELTDMTIKFQHNPLQWDICVKRDKGIRVRDVFEAIYSAFDKPLTPHEKSLIPHHLHAGYEEAFRLRCNLAPVLPFMQENQGWKRVDVLLYETIFCGLAQSKRGDWTLNLSGTMSKTIDRRRLISDHIAADSTVRHRPRRGLLWDHGHIFELGPTPSYSPPTLPVLELPGEYLPSYPNQNSNALPSYSNNDLFNLPLSATFVPRAVIDSDIVLPSQGACRICNFVRFNAILKHGTLCTLLNNIPPLITEPSTQDYTWAFFCRFVPLGALFDSPCRGPLPMIQLGSDRARLVEGLEADFVEHPSNVNAMSWLHGPSGTGKSVIAYNLASRCKQKNRLAGSFFFSRRHANCRSARSLVLALAYQLGLSHPQAKEKIIKALDNDPSIVSPSRDLREQFARLLIEPLEAVVWRSPSNLFVVDAVDQCQDQVHELISLLTRLLSHMMDVGLRIFFTSRDHVGVLIKRHHSPMRSDIALDRTVITRDVRLFFRQSFDKIHKRHRLQCRKPWPPEEVLGRLVDRVGPYFITGSIIVKFVGSLDHDPTDRMDLVDCIPFDPSSPPESSMDGFYKSIISTADDLEQAYLHLTIVVNLAGMLSFSQLDDLLNRGSNQKFDIRSALSQLSPLVHIPDGHDSAVQVCHESLYDFLSNSLRCGKQFISQAVVHRLLAYSSLSIMMKELPDDSPLCSRLSQLTTESSPVSLNTFDNADVLAFAIYSPPVPLPFLSLLWHITQRQNTGLQADFRTALALRYFCCTWQILQHLDLSTVDALPAFRFLVNFRSLPLLLAFPIFLAFETPRSGQTSSPSTQEQELHMEMLHAVAEIVNDVHALKDRCRSDSGALDYACTHWVYHLSLAEWDDDLRSILTAFMGQKLQQWLVKAWCLQDFETCLRTLCELQELYSTANTKAEHEAEKVGSARRSTKEVVNGVNAEAEQAEVARHSITETAEDVQKISNIGASSS
ncbi:uncharacterized protein BJ212DRAFT_581583 [Suillus subaureus]|uniref:NACHT domain-containing protein n=1 Tax=Suillus subaureus TaxID=48587 RepID=A0A9P7DIX4_9AGAM|nr:uncharacterized protein BJ212DRAFT_581583 [Suillus subaureus]KAG1795533.1 hypothetical protein BJ212DRAFT_581583 [Suillus subaureus]